MSGAGPWPSSMFPIRNCTSSQSRTCKELKLGRSTGKGKSLDRPRGWGGGGETDRDSPPTSFQFMRGRNCREADGGFLAMMGIGDRVSFGLSKKTGNGALHGKTTIALEMSSEGEVWVLSAVPPASSLGPQHSAPAGPIMAVGLFSRAWMGGKRHRGGRGV